MFDQFIFIVSAFATVIGALLVLFLRNIMHACMALLLCFFGVAGLYLTLSADFVAAVQLTVYIGGMIILMMFAIMLTGGQGFKSKMEDFFNLPNSMGTKRTYLISFFCTVPLIIILFYITQYALKSVKVLEHRPFESTLKEIGTQLLTKHVLVFEMSSVLLLGALAGAAMIARPRKDITVSETKDGNTTTYKNVEERT